MQHGAFTRRMAAMVGVSWKAVEARIRSGTLTEPAPGVLVLGGLPTTWHQRVAVATLAGGGAVASHRTAARLHGLDGFDSDVIEVSVPVHRRAAQSAATVHRVAALETCDIIVVDDIPSTTVARTLADLGSVTTRRQVLKALDAARRAGVSTRWCRQTAERLHRPGQAGTGVLLRLLDEAEGDRVPESWLERLVEELLAAPGFPPLVRQHVVRDDAGRFVARVDLAIPSLCLAIEAHSRRFHFGDGAGATDEDRDLRLTACGWETLYLGYQHTKRPGEVVPLVLQTVARRKLNR
ncbi:MAG TPA: hypothetical protein VGF22_00355 [Acidimicrobiales bacterium]|jgi:hypothetical protein